eukprot:1314088-Amphidinium_carterae.2
MKADGTPDSPWEDVAKHVGFINEDFGGALDSLVTEVAKAEEEQKKQQTLGTLSSTSEAVATVAQKARDLEDGTVFALPVQELMSFAKAWSVAKEYKEALCDDDPREELIAAESDILLCIYTYLQQGEGTPAAGDDAKGVLESTVRALIEMAEVGGVVVQSA